MSRPGLDQLVRPVGQLEQRQVAADVLLRPPHGASQSPDREVELAQPEVGGGLLDRVERVPVDVLDDGRGYALGVGERPDDHRHVLDLGGDGGGVSAVAGDDEVVAVGQRLVRGDEQRLDDADALDAAGQLVELAEAAPHVVGCRMQPGGVDQGDRLGGHDGGGHRGAPSGEPGKEPASRGGPTGVIESGAVEPVAATGHHDGGAVVSADQCVVPGGCGRAGLSHSESQLTDDRPPTGVATDSKALRRLAGIDGDQPTLRPGGLLTRHRQPPAGRRPERSLRQERASLWRAVPLAAVTRPTYVRGIAHTTKPARRH